MGAFSITERFQPHIDSLMHLFLFIIKKYFPRGKNKWFEMYCPSANFSHPPENCIVMGYTHLPIHHTPCPTQLACCILVEGCYHCASCVLHSLLCTASGSVQWFHTQRNRLLGPFLILTRSSWLQELPALWRLSNCLE